MSIPPTITAVCRHTWLLPPAGSLAFESVELVKCGKGRILLGYATRLSLLFRYHSPLYGNTEVYIGATVWDASLLELEHCNFQIEQGMHCCPFGGFLEQMNCQVPCRDCALLIGVPE
jgi:hypothetical protein